MSETLTGQIKSVRYYNESNAYIVMSVETQELERPVTMTGYLPHYSLELTYRFTGEFLDHPRYGHQFQIESYEQLAINDSQALIRYLSSALFKGIGPSLATAIVETLGENALERIQEDPSCLDQVDKLSDQVKRNLIDTINLQNESEKSLRYLLGLDVSMKTAMKIINVYPEGIEEILQYNPYELMEQVEGFGFKTADNLAMKLGFDEMHHFRLEAALLTTLKQLCMNQGSTYILFDVLKNQFQRAFNYHEDIFDLIQALINDGKVVEEEGRYYPFNLYDSEKIIRRVLSRFIYSEGDMDFDYEDLETQLGVLEEEWNIEYDESQRDAIASFIENDCVILTGGPGTGKTTIVRAMIALYKKLAPTRTIALVAPTGRAGKRLSEACNHEATTIHRLLKWDVNTNTFNCDEDHPLDVDVLIVDEFSMVDTFLFAQLLKACNHVTKILLIGDEAQLPSIAPGQVLYDLMATGEIETITLRHIFRQQANSGIVSISHALRNQEFESLDQLKDYKDIHFMPCREQEMIPLVTRIVTKALNEGYDLYDFQVLCPMYDGMAGIDAINRALQDLINPADPFKPEVKIFNKIYREGDKVLQLKNRPDDNVFNGDIGMIIEIQKRDNVIYLQDKIIVDFEGDIVEYTSQDFTQLTLAYCMSIHKAQGSEFRIVLMPIISSQSRMLRKNLIYTGMTRAKQSLFLLGDANAFIEGIKKDESLRKTTLQERFNETTSIYDFLDD